MIPKIIHQTWKDTNLPDIFSNILNENKKINEEFDFKLWIHSPIDYKYFENDNDIDNRYNIDKLIKNFSKELYMIYLKCKYGVQKSDIARLIILYQYGGIYIDLDILSIKSFNNLIDYNSNKVYLSLEPEEQTIKVFNKNNVICNALLIAPEKHILFKKALESIIDLFRKYGDKIYYQFNIFGGDLVADIIKTNQDVINTCDIINTKIVFPINDPKFNDLSCSKTDWELLKNGKYNENVIMVHYWIHSDFESKELINSFKLDSTKNIHENIFKFFTLLYPNNYNKFLKN